MFLVINTQPSFFISYEISRALSGLSVLSGINIKSVIEELPLEPPHCSSQKPNLQFNLPIESIRGGIGVGVGTKVGVAVLVALGGTMFVGGGGVSVAMRANVGVLGVGTVQDAKIKPSAILNTFSLYRSFMTHLLFVLSGGRLFPSSPEEEMPDTQSLRRG